MAVLVHTVNVAIRKVTPTGKVLIKDDVTETLKEHINFSQQYRIIEDPNIPNSMGSPTVPAYLTAEAVDNYVVKYMDHYTIITYKRNNGDGGFAAS